MTVQMWVGSPLMDDVITLREPLELSVPNDLVWFSDPQCDTAYRAQSAVQQLHSVAASQEVVWALLQSHNNTNGEASYECLTASLGTLEGQGRLLDALRQREPQQLVIWLSATGDSVNLASTATIAPPSVSLLTTWVIGVTVLVSGALALMKKYSGAKIVIVLPRLSPAEQHHAHEVHAAEAYLRAWVAASQASVHDADLALSIIKLPTVDA
jgi:hypothetical protein